MWSQGPPANIDYFLGPLFVPGDKNKPPIIYIVLFIVFLLVFPSIPVEYGVKQFNTKYILNVQN